MSPIQYVTLVAAGGTPVRLADVNGTPFATSGTGALLFGNGPTLTNATLINPIFSGGFGFGMGSAAAPSIFFGGIPNQNSGIYSSAPGHTSFSSAGVLVAEFSSTGLALFSKAITSGSWQGDVITTQYGGTGLTGPYTVGDLLVANGAQSLAPLSDVATGNALISGGVGAAPSWGKIGLATHVSGNLPVSNLNGGTGADGTKFWCGDGTWKVPTVPAAGLQIGVTAITSGTNTRVLFDNGGLLGEYAVSGTGSVAMTNSPTFVTPILGAAAATSLAIGGAVLGGNALAVTGTAVFNSGTTLSGALTYGGVTLTNAVAGTGKMVLDNSPSLITPTLGVATATTINKVTITTPSVGATLTIANAKTLTVSNTVTLSGTDGSTISFGGGGAVVYNGGALGTPSSGTLTNCSGLPAAGIVAGALANGMTATTQAAGDSSTKLATTAFVATATAPSGAIMAYGGSAAPSGWILCDGSAVSRATFAALFAAIGTTFGAGDGSTTFNVPDLRGRVPAGVDGGAGRLGSGASGGITGAATLGAAGGQQSHTLTASEQASMSVSVSVSGDITGTANVPNGYDGTNTAAANFNSSPVTTVAAAVTGSFSGSGSGTASGGGQAHNVTQPTLVVNYIIKA